VTRRAFVGATLVDGTGAAPLPAAAVVVDGERIAWVGRAADLGGDVEVVDVSGLHLLPGLLDANVHLVLNCDPDVLLRYEPGAYDELVLEAAQVTLRAGVTTVFDTWGPLEALRRVRDRIDAGEAVGSRIRCAGNIIGNDGPWSTDFFPPYGQALNPDVVARVNAHWEQGVGAELTWLPAEGVREAVRQYLETSGVDLVKYASSAHREGRFVALAPDAQRAIVEEAHAAGLTVQACTQTPEALKLALEAGVDLLAHGANTGPSPMPDDLVELIAERGVGCGVCLTTRRHVEAARVVPGNYGRMLDAAGQNVDALLAAGARLTLATDAGVFGVDWERSPWVGGLAAGVPDTPLHLGTAHVLWFRAAAERELGLRGLQAATRDVAEAYGLGAELGTVEAGKRADLVVLDGDPLRDPGAYERVVHVVKDGVLVDRGRLPERPVLTREVL
jgi:imidazolonepropionase-like amidohydrolase